MKISHIIAIIVIGICIAVIISTGADASQYVNFSTAYNMAKDGDDSKVHVVGKLKKTKSGKIADLQYNPVADPNFVAFTLIDAENSEHQVIYYHPKPQDLERSEQIVVVGRVKNGQFVADDILLKCPSKYQENKLETEL